MSVAKVADEMSRFCASDLDLDPMTLIYEFDLNILNIRTHVQK